MKLNLYPYMFKCFRITPLYKKNERTIIIIDNHRPISSLCNISKVFDTLLHERITQYFMCNGLLSENQFGFRRDRNTELATLQLIDKILPVYAEGSYCICVFLDSSSCLTPLFSREILYTKLYRYGVRGSELILLRHILITDLNLSRMMA